MHTTDTTANRAKCEQIRANPSINLAAWHCWCFTPSRAASQRQTLYMRILMTLPRARHFRCCKGNRPCSVDRSCSAGPYHRIVVAGSSRYVAAVPWPSPRGYRSSQPMPQKHGALSTDEGRVSIHWQRRWNFSSPPTTVLEWQETGGLSVTAPTHLATGPA